jgi:hypothetical protein
VTAADSSTPISLHLFPLLSQEGGLWAGGRRGRVQGRRGLVFGQERHHDPWGAASRGLIGRHRTLRRSHLLFGRLLRLRGARCGLLEIVLEGEGALEGLVIEDPLEKLLGALVGRGDPSAVSLIGFRLSLLVLPLIARLFVKGTAQEVLVSGTGKTVRRKEEGGEEGYLAALRALSRRILLISSVSRTMICWARWEKRRVSKQVKSLTRWASLSCSILALGRDPSQDLSKAASMRSSPENWGRRRGKLGVATGGGASHLFTHRRLLQNRKHRCKVWALQNLMLLVAVGRWEEEWGVPSVCKLPTQPETRQRFPPRGHNPTPATPLEMRGCQIETGEERN